MDKITTGRRAPFGSNPEVGDAGKATQQRIIAAAADAFTEFGYARTSVEAITDQAGCSRPTFYQYFSGKEDLYRRLAARLGRTLSTLLGQLGPVTPDTAGRDQLHLWLIGLTDTYTEHRAVANSFSASVRTDSQMVTGAATLSSSYQDALVNALTDPLPTEDLDALANVLNSAAFGACVYRERIGEVSTARLAAALADFVHRALFGPLAGVNTARRRTARVSAPAATGERSASGSSLSTNSLADGQRSARGALTRERLLEAARIAFSTLGYERVRVDDISREADVSHGTFYRYFADKDAVFTELTVDATERTITLIETLPTTDDLAAWTLGHFDMYADFGGVISSLPEARRSGVPIAESAREQMTTALSQVLDSRGFGDTDADLVIAFSLLENVPAAAFRGGGISIDAAAGASSLALSRGLLGRI